MKVEMLKNQSTVKQLKRDAFLLMDAVKHEDRYKRHFPFLYNRGKVDGLFNYVIMTFGDYNLNDLRINLLNGCDFSRPNAARLVMQTFQAVHDLHSLGFIHRDISPTKFIFGLDNPQIVYMIGFSLSYHFEQHYETKPSVSPRRLPKLSNRSFRSRSYHRNKEMNRKDDLESWVYLSFNLFGRRLLPWDEQSTDLNMFVNKERLFCDGCVSESVLLRKAFQEKKTIYEVDFDKEEETLAVASKEEKRLIIRPKNEVQKAYSGPFQDVENDEQTTDVNPEVATRPLPPIEQKKPEIRQQKPKKKKKVVPQKAEDDQPPDEEIGSSGPELRKYQSKRSDRAFSPAVSQPPTGPSNAELLKEMNEIKRQTALMSAKLDALGTGRENKPLSRKKKTAKEEGGVVESNKQGYVVIELLGEGGFGAVYKVHAQGDKTREYAMKVEKKVAILKLVGSARGEKSHFTRIVDRGKKSNFFFIVMQLVGKSLADLKHQAPTKSFSIGTALGAGKQCLEAVEDLHNFNFVHRDIKPANYACGLGEQKTRRKFLLLFSPTLLQIYILDFGIARRLTKSNNELKTPRQLVGFKGTVRFASLACHRGEEMGKKDDCESWFYLLMDLIQSSGLPWRKMSDKNEVKDCKIRCRNEGSPEQDKLYHKQKGRAELIRVITYIDQLRYEHPVDYSYIYELLKLAGTKYDVKDIDAPYDWEVETPQSFLSCSRRSAAAGEPQPSLYWRPDDSTQPQVLRIHVHEIRGLKWKARNLIAVLKLIGADEWKCEARTEPRLLDPNVGGCTWNDSPLTGYTTLKLRVVSPRRFGPTKSLGKVRLPLGSLPRESSVESTWLPLESRGRVVGRVRLDFEFADSSRSVSPKQSREKVLCCCSVGFPFLPNRRQIQLNQNAEPSPIPTVPNSPVDSSVKTEQKPENGCVDVLVRLIDELREQCGEQEKQIRGFQSYIDWLLPRILATNPELLERE
ncbi:Protein kinase domain-containing protein [Aphelenchoides besseyi]|nr:Protein kinase domain-containing protein [Aphelenchoides besseyi]